MDEQKQSGIAVTQAFIPSGPSRSDLQSQRLADVTRAYRNAVADEAEEAESYPTIQYGEPPRSPSDDPHHASDDPHESDVEELLLDDDRAVGAGCTAASTPAEESLADDADELASYMKSFMQRMKCKSAEPDDEPPPPPKEQPREQQPQRQYQGPKSAPEQQCDLQRMREVANATARTSLSHHAARICDRTRQWLVLSALCCVIAAILAYISPAIASYGYIAAVVVFGAAIAAAYRFQLGLKKLGPELSQTGRPSATA